MLKALLIIFAGSCTAYQSARGASLYIDPQSAASSPTFSNSLPYPVTAADLWNGGLSTTWGSGGTVKYTDGSTATGVTITLDALGAAGSDYVYDFASAGATYAGNGTSMTGIFAANPLNNSNYGPNFGSQPGGVATRVTGLTAGTYDIYVVAAYTGATTGSHPGGASPAQQSVWAFGGPSGTDSLITGSFGTANDVLENSTSASWVAGNNYSKVTVTLDASNPDLFIIAEGYANDSKRGWLSAMQIVPVPEPSALFLTAFGSIALLGRRRRIG